MSLKSLIATGTKVWLDSIDPDYVRKIDRSEAPARPVIRSSSPT